MIRPSGDILKALISLENSRDFQIITEWIKQSAGTASVSSTLLEKDVLSRWMQGRSQELQEIYNYITNSRKYLKGSEPKGEI